MPTKVITTLFFDVGGVILTNGWDHAARQRAADTFDLDYDQMQKRHQPLFEEFERGFLSRSTYLEKVVFSQKRTFSREVFIDFMQQQSQPYSSTLDILKKLQKDKNYELATINNESLELNCYRIEQFELGRFFTAFFSSCFLGVRKPERRIFETSLQVLQKTPDECLFIDDREENVAAAEDAGMQIIHLPDVTQLEQKLVAKGIQWNS